MFHMPKQAQITNAKPRLTILRSIICNSPTIINNEDTNALILQYVIPFRITFNLLLLCTCWTNPLHSIRPAVSIGAAYTPTTTIVAQIEMT